MRHEKDKAASVKFGEERGTGSSGIKTPGEKAGDRMRMYHPCFGRWIIQQIVDVWLCYDKFSVQFLSSMVENTHDDMFNDLLVREEAFLALCETVTENSVKQAVLCTI